METCHARRGCDELRQRRNVSDLLIDSLRHYIDSVRVSQSVRPARLQLVANRCSAVGRGS